MSDSLVDLGDFLLGVATESRLPQVGYSLRGGTVEHTHLGLQV
ncbi:hypothetical protein [Corynebacterium glutamicum]|nr:hypothetical protein [Corynebacterium glutamicum]